MDAGSHQYEETEGAVDRRQARAIDAQKDAKKQRDLNGVT